MPKNLINKFFQLESAGGIVLFIAALLAMLWANSSYRDFYFSLSQQHFAFWVNEGLMSLFFLVVGLELKRSFREGQFENLTQVMLPIVGAVGGMLVPALIYLLFNYHNPHHLQGWAIPVATDIAFAVSALSLFGKRVPNALKLFLLTLAIFDDVGAILIIAFWYTHGTTGLSLLICLIPLLMLYGFNKWGIQSLIPYLLIGIALWYACLHAGINPTVSGVLLALSIPYHDKQNHHPEAANDNTHSDDDHANDHAKDHADKSPLHILEEHLHPYVAFFIMPLFALTNAGFSFEHFSGELFASTIVIGITFGLFVGKQIGVIGGVWLFIRCKCTQLPANISWLSLYGVALLCGIGFTMSLFLGTLSFQNESLHLAAVRFGVIMGSLLSGLCGALVLIAALTNERAEQEDNVA